MERTKNVVLQMVAQDSCNKYGSTPGKAGNVVFFNGTSTAAGIEASTLRARSRRIRSAELGGGTSAKPTCLSKRGVF